MIIVNKLSKLYELLPHDNPRLSKNDIRKLSGISTSNPTYRKYILSLLMEGKLINDDSFKDLDKYYEVNKLPKLELARLKNDIKRILLEEIDNIMGIK